VSIPIVMFKIVVNTVLHFSVKIVSCVCCMFIQMWTLIGFTINVVLVLYAGAS